MHRFEHQQILIQRLGLGQRFGTFFQTHGPLKDLKQTQSMHGRVDRLPRHHGQSRGALGALEVERQLGAQRIHERPALPKDDARGVRRQHGAGERIWSTCDLAHRIHGTADTLRRDARGSQFPQLAELRQAIKGIRLGRFNQPSALPHLQLLCREAQDA